MEQVEKKIISISEFNELDFAQQQNCLPDIERSRTWRRFFAEAAGLKASDFSQDRCPFDEANDWLVGHWLYKPSNISVTFKTCASNVNIALRDVNPPPYEGEGFPEVGDDIISFVELAEANNVVTLVCSKMPSYIDTEESMTPSEACKRLRLSMYLHSTL